MLIDLSLPIEDGMPTLPGLLPEVRVGAALDHEASRERYQGKAEFLLSSYELAGNTGTYVDSPFHRHRDGQDLAAVELDRLASIPAVVVEADVEGGPVDLPLDGEGIRGRAVLVRTGWDRRYPNEDYWRGGPFLSPASLDLLVEAPVALVGVDFLNVDDTTDPVRPAHTRLLAAGIPIVERLRGLDRLPRDGFRFSAVPPPIVGGASFPVRAYAELPNP